jgi:hypothetical protein
MGYSIDWTECCAYVSYSGHCTEADVLGAVIQLQSDYRFFGTHHALHDFCQCKTMSASQNRLEELACIIVGAALSNPRLRIAVIPFRADVLAMLERFCGVGAKSYAWRVFENAGNATAWLGSTPSNSIRA